jgi:hypothetical protein
MPSTSPDPSPVTLAAAASPPAGDAAGPVGALADADVFAPVGPLAAGAPPGAVAAQAPGSPIPLDAALSLEAPVSLDAPALLEALVPLDGWFSPAGTLAMAGWLALVVFPKSPLVTDRLVGLGVPTALGVLYAGLILAFWAGSPGGYGSLDEVAALFSVRGLLLAGWVHYLAFDLFVGAWQVRTARAEKIPHLLVVPCLLMTFLFGPVGLLMFLGLRLARGLSRTQGAPA